MRLSRHAGAPGQTIPRAWAVGLDDVADDASMSVGSMLAFVSALYQCRFAKKKTGDNVSGLVILGGRYKI